MQRKPTRPPSERKASATDPDWQRMATCPGAVVDGGRPIQAIGPSGTTTPMQLGPTIAAPSSRARAASRATIGAAAGPASAPTPGTTKARTPAAAASSNACSTRSWLTSSRAVSGVSGRSAKDGKHSSPATSPWFGFTPQASTPLRTTVSTASTFRGEAPTTASERGKRSARTSGTRRILALRSRAMVHEKRIEIRWRDVDAYQHVNNAVYATYLEECRDEWLTRALDGEGDEWNFVLARVAIDFRRELRLEDESVVVTCRLERIGTASITLHEEIHAEEGWLAARSEAVVVARDREKATARPLTDSERAAFERASSSLPSSS